MSKQPSKMLLLREAEQQQNALKRLARWMRNAMVLSSCAVVLACGVTGIVLAVLSAWFEALPVKAAVFYLCAYLLFQWGVGIWFFKRMLRRYQ